METARDRYEAKTRVVTFRVSHELYDEVSRIKADSGLSFGDLIKLGADIAGEEVRDKIAEISELQEKLEALRRQAESEMAILDETLKKEKQKKIQKLDREMEVFRLFDFGWNIEEVSMKLGSGRNEPSRIFFEWATMREEREKIREELLKKCLRTHIRLLTSHLVMRASGKEYQEVNDQLRRCRYLVMHPSDVLEEGPFFLKHV